MEDFDITFGMAGGGEAARTEDNGGYRDSGQNYGFEDSISDDVNHVPPQPSYNEDEQTYSQENYGGFSTPSTFEPGSNDNLKQLGSDTEGIFSSAGNGGPLLPDPIHMREEGTAFREWRSLNAIYLEEKAKEEKELRNQLISEADEFKRAFVERRQKNKESNTALNIEREKLYLINQEKFHKEADKHYWKAIAELIPREVATIDKRRGMKEKEDETKPGIVVIQGPKPGKPTDLSRMRQLFLNLKQNPPPHMIPPETDTKDKEKRNTNTEVLGGTLTQKAEEAKQTEQAPTA